MTSLTPSRDALTKALCHEYHPMHWDVAYSNQSKPCRACRTHAAALIASGAVIDASTLADNEALVERVAFLGDLTPLNATLALRALAVVLLTKGEGVPGGPR
jgi:hypothetical protein